MFGGDSDKRRLDLQENQEKGEQGVFDGMDNVKDGNQLKRTQME